jgi:hypothetical protein
VVYWHCVITPAVGDDLRPGPALVVPHMRGGGTEFICPGAPVTPSPASVEQGKRPDDVSAVQGRGRLTPWLLARGGLRGDPGLLALPGHWV